MRQAAAAEGNLLCATDAENVGAVEDALVLQRLANAGADPCPDPFRATMLVVVVVKENLLRRQQVPCGVGPSSEPYGAESLPA